MNQTSLSTKLALAVLAAIFIPLMVLTYTSFTSVNDVARVNLEAYIAESGGRRQEAIENDMRAALNIANDFVTAQQAALIEPLIARENAVVVIDIREAERILRESLRAELIGSGYFESARLLSTNFQILASVALPGSSGLSGLSLQELTSLERIVDDFNAGNTQSLTVINRGGTPSVSLISAVFAPESEGRTVIGYLLTNLNLETIIVDNLIGQASPNGTYAYVILPGTNDVIAAEDVLQSGRIDITSPAVERALNNRATAVDDYEIGPEDNRQLVLGYSTAITIDDLNFALVVEVPGSAIQDQILQRGLTFIFPYITGTVTLVLVIVVFLTNQMVVPPVNRLRRAFISMLRGNFDEPVPDARRGDEIGTLATSFVDLREYVRTLTEEMNERLRERTRDVQITQQISRAVTAERDLNRLMNRIVELVAANFPAIYHAQIFIIDEQRRYALLRASTGEAGEQLLARGHRLAVGSISVIGQVTEQGRIIIARDTAESDVHRRNEFLPDTRAELAIPLQLGDNIIGALDVQSKQSNAFNQDEVNALQTLADQITIAIENARLYAESERLLASIERERALQAQRQWQQYLYERRTERVSAQAGAKTDYTFAPLIEAVYQGRKSVVGDVTERDTIPFVVPILLRGQVLGTVEYELPKAEFTYDKVLLAEELTARLALGLENARLFQSSQQTIERERMVNEISTRLTSQTEIEDIIQMAIREVGQALRTPQVAIKLNMSGRNGNGANGSNGSHPNTDSSS